MQPLLLVSEESQFLLRILNGSFQTLDIIKDRIVHAFADLFCSKANLDVIDLRQDNVVQSVNREDWSSKGNNSNREGDLTVGFNVLDAMLKHSLDRLKSMRERIPSAEGISNCTLEINFNKDAYVIRAMCLDGKRAAALSLWCNMIQNGTIPDVITHNYLINGLCKNGELEKAEWIVRGMLYRGPAPSCATYNSLIRGYCLMNDVDKGLNTFSTMANHGIIPNRVTCNILVHALCKKGLMEEAKKLFHKLLSKNYEGGSSDLITSTIMMDGCFKNGDTDQALAFWERMLKRLGFVPDVYSYNTIVGALCKEGKISDACYIYDVMTRMGVSPDQITYKMIIQALCINREIIRANCFLDYMLENSIIPEPRVWNVIIDGYGRCGDIQNASYIRDKMVANGVLPNIYTYNALIYAQIKSGNLSAAQSLEKEMLSYGLIPDSVTYNLLIGAACNLGLIHSALELHDEMLRKGCQPDVITYTELLKWYCLQGRMTEADKLFGKLLSSDESASPGIVVKLRATLYVFIPEEKASSGFCSGWLTDFRSRSCSRSNSCLCLPEVCFVAVTLAFWNAIFLVHADDFSLKQKEMLLLHSFLFYLNKTVDKENSPATGSCLSYLKTKRKGVGMDETNVSTAQAAFLASSSLVCKSKWKRLSTCLRLLNNTIRLDALRAMKKDFRGNGDQERGKLQSFNGYLKRYGQRS
ncbi:hypothetical protein RND71_042556 [Anisodus tanguticus]|uniref:Pentatricopeptide repeat-containing protein n=1 Tax=Anisodus tanguticus TaxID=243964 RepID=A0AAE1QQE7_9SOLA|nr:hypothetical protein RND71_042556 [Anisodus tanguticus]